MTEAILSIFTYRRKRPEMDAIVADRLALMRYRIAVLGDKEREMNRWRDDFYTRKGRAA